MKLWQMQYRRGVIDIVRGGQMTESDANKEKGAFSRARLPRSVAATERARRSSNPQVLIVVGFILVGRGQDSSTWARTNVA